MQLLDLTPERAKVLREVNVDVPDEGVLIVEVVPDSPASKAGLRGGDREVPVGDARISVGGDVLLAIDGNPTRTLRELSAYLERHAQVGDVVQAHVLRDGHEATFGLTLAERPPRLR